MHITETTAGKRSVILPGEPTSKLKTVATDGRERQGQGSRDLADVSERRRLVSGLAGAAGFAAGDVLQSSDLLNGRVRGWAREGAVIVYM
ncbi:hypothetical protein Dda_2620 [Drechslerella dactyloides]|uniref:Uncharacterized protein n=1 Tax=Drechslerella dactyloides TaxID=74499 RepID=A0AAD6NJJ9_DREDA|nr:hypothetical protein Dda_2620 [Drechslerella dactyloides]